MARVVVSLLKRPLDLLLLAFFLVNGLVIVYLIDFEQVAVPPFPQPGAFKYPAFPPRVMVDIVHWWGRSFDPLLMARPVWWQMTIWIDAFYFGPFYFVAVFAFLKGKEWIKAPALFWAGLMVANLTIIFGEEFAGPYKSPAPLQIVAAYGPYLLAPLLTLIRMARVHPFTEKIHPQKTQLHTKTQ
eukprot:TRINITY_DN18305_c0_g1_i1.p2 TRINITY_DN18305_c0_g1~~TRINITY_DN18305_c0_g1_i1.p2  ORF type:complete len:194 (+),score=46.13 TRINITY_DN18305_c0_g1_i1:30-584(+)